MISKLDRKMEEHTKLVEEIKNDDEVVESNKKELIPLATSEHQEVVLRYGSFLYIQALINTTKEYGTKRGHLQPSKIDDGDVSTTCSKPEATRANY
ncbi:hypothetical protein C5167_006477 [Papaver somniferum]|uniref:Uncharacterized protein n=1 Tax=Papaver somniferum TaxID=3469 RepID=A0A4Y7JGL2_PAPSO|nr:hypothetical protein C5167_006477 [Papaver somniferum]